MNAHIFASLIGVILLVIHLIQGGDIWMTGMICIYVAAFAYVGFRKRWR